MGTGRPPSLARVLDRSPLLAELDRAAREALTQVLETRELAAGQVLWPDDEPLEDLVLVERVGGDCFPAELVALCADQPGLPLEAPGRWQASSLRRQVRDRVAVVVPSEEARPPPAARRRS